MLVSGSMVLTGLDDHYTPIERLEMGDCIVNPVSMRRHRIVAIKRRDVVYEGLWTDTNLSLRPLAVPPDLMAPHVPHKELLLSPKQSVCVVGKKPGQQSIAEIKVLTASELLEHHLLDAPIMPGRFTYHALFTERPQVMDVNGLLLGSAGAADMALTENLVWEFEGSSTTEKKKSFLH